MKLVKNTYLFLAVAIVLTSVLSLVRWEWLSNIKLLFLIILPSLPLILGYFLADKINKRYMIISIPLVCVMLFLWGCGMLFFEALHRATTPITDISRYEKVLENDKSMKEMIEHFPAKVPSDARDVKFVYFQGFLQGGPYIFLRYISTSKNVEKLYKYYSEKAEKIVVPGESYNGSIPDNLCFTYESGKREFSKDHVIIYLDLTRKPGAGVVINKKINEIVYWTQIWY
jgi:hypothetical protein